MLAEVLARARAVNTYVFYALEMCVKISQRAFGTQSHLVLAAWGAWGIALCPEMLLAGGKEHT